MRDAVGDTQHSVQRDGEGTSGIRSGRQGESLLKLQILV